MKATTGEPTCGHFPSMLGMDIGLDCEACFRKANKYLWDDTDPLTGKPRVYEKETLVSTK